MNEQCWAKIRPMPNDTEILCGLVVRIAEVFEVPTVSDEFTDAACGCPCHRVIRPGLVPCPRCEQESGSQ